MVKIRHLLNLIGCLLILFLSINNSYAIETKRGMGMLIYDFKSNNYSYPAFKIFIRTPNNEIIGWDENKGEWTGSIKKSYVRTEPEPFLEIGGECTSVEPYVERIINLSSGVSGDYVVNNALYCKNEKNENVFISGTYAMNMGNALDGKYEIVLIPYKHAMIDFCYNFGVESTEPVNELCTNDNYMKQLLITPNTKQTIEITYNYKDLKENRIKKVVTPVILTEEWEGCNQLGMIKNQGIYTSIKKKLQTAKEKYDAGDIKTSENIRNAVINEIEAQYGKGIQPQCAGILLNDLRNWK